jgi:chloramphenicol-sensitive protein RarD
VYGEPFEGARVLGFCLIWLALGIYTLEGWWWNRALARTVGKKTL